MLLSISFVISFLYMNLVLNVTIESETFKYPEQARIYFNTILCQSLNKPSLLDYLHLILFLN